MDLIESIKCTLEGKSDDVKMMVLQRLNNLLDRRNSPQYFEKVVQAFYVPRQALGIGKEEAFVFNMELKNILLAFSDLTPEEARKIKAFLQEEIAKLACVKSESLETFMRKGLSDIVTAASVPFFTLVSKTALEAFLTISQEFYDESFQLLLFHALKDDSDKKELADRIYKLLCEYCEKQNIQIMLSSEVQFHTTLAGRVCEMLIWGKRQKKDSVQYSQIFITIASERILVSRKDFVH